MNFVAPFFNLYYDVTRARLFDSQTQSMVSRSVSLSLACSRQSLVRASFDVLEHSKNKECGVLASSGRLLRWSDPRIPTRRQYRASRFVRWWPGNIPEQLSSIRCDVVRDMAVP